MKTETMMQNRQFYEEAVAPMIRRDFPDHAERIAAGVAGEGSDCFGFDDEISRDHDFGTGVCLWITEEDAKVFGQALQNSYQRTLVDWHRNNAEAAGLPGADLTRLQMRRGVQTIGGFYYNNLGVRIDPAAPALTDGAWFYTDEWRFAAAVNGEIFRDDAGCFTRIRELLQGYYPDRIWKMRIVNALHDYAAAMQANYARCMARKDPVAAEFCRTRSMDAAMNIFFLLRKTYAPYYKWKYRALQDLPGSEALVSLLAQAAACPADPEVWKDVKYDPRRVNTNDRLIGLFEQIAALLVRELQRAGLTDSDNPFLEAHCAAVSSRIQR